jgi:hypothetical protein
MCYMQHETRPSTYSPSTVFPGRVGFIPKSKERVVHVQVLTLAPTGDVQAVCFCAITRSCTETVNGMLCFVIEITKDFMLYRRIYYVLNRA